MTDAERLLWSKLRRKQVKNYQFYRQRIIENYIVDFYCPSSKLIKVRDDYMKSLGIIILRVSDREVLKNLHGIVQRIYEIL